MSISSDGGDSGAIEEEANVDGHGGVLAMDADVFAENVRLIESAFVNLAAAYYFNPYSGGHTIDVFDFFEEADSFESWVEVRKFAVSVQQLVFFAFEHAPAEIIRSWGDDHIEGGGDRAVERVQLIRSVMVEGYREWTERFTDLGATFGDVKTTLVHDKEQDTLKTVIRLNSFFAEGLRRVPVVSSRQYLSAVLSRRDLRRLIDHLQMADAMYDEDDEEGAGDAEA